jgi:hypothetical protein
MTFHVTRGAVWNTFSTNQVRTTTNGLKLTVLSGTHHLPPDAFGFGDASYGPANTNDAFDGALSLIVGGRTFVNPDNTVDLTGDTLTTDKVASIVPHIDARVEYWFSPTRPVIRAIYSLTNTSASDITTDLLVVGNYGSDANTTIEASADGDSTLQTADFITSDNGASNDLLVLTIRFGEGAGVIPTNALTPGGGEDDYGLRYHVTVPANGTIHVRVFHQVASPTAGVAPLSPVPRPISNRWTRSRPPDCSRVSPLPRRPRSSITSPRPPTVEAAVVAPLPPWA